MLLRNHLRQNFSPARPQWPGLAGILATLIFSLLITACAPSAAPAAQAPEQPAAPQETETAQPLPTATASNTPQPSDTPSPPESSTIEPTETPQATLELPTLPARLPERILWTGLPTYPGDSLPGVLFRVEYDPQRWAQTEDNYDEIVLAHRELPGCVLSAEFGRGLPLTWKVESDFSQEGGLFIETNRIFSEENLEFITFFISDSRVRTAFRLDPGENADACLQDSQEILLSLRSLFASPTATPTP